jgi:excisionase family DNA binding protein
MPSRPKSDSPSERPLFVRLPAREADELDRAAFEGGVSKRELVTQMVQRYLEAEPLTVLGAADMRVGRHAFRPDATPEVLTLDQAAALLQVDPAAVADLAERGELPGRRIGKEWRFSRAALLRWLGD